MILQSRFKTLFEAFHHLADRPRGRTIPQALRQSRWAADLFLILLLAGLALGFLGYGKQAAGALQTRVVLDLSPWMLPLYAFFSLSRGLLAYVLSLAFSLSWGFWAAKDRVAEKALIPLLDVLQSIPILGFMPGLVLLLVALFPRTNAGLEAAAVLMMFTSQAWNMAFAVYHSVRTLPQDKAECARVYGLNAWQQMRWVELPFTTIALVWNSIMSMAGGWFFLMVNEAFQLGDRDFRIPGLGSYMSVAAAQGNVPAMLWAILAMVGLIVFLDQLLWRPLVVWAQKFRVEDTSPNRQAESWFLNLLKRSRLVEALQKVLQGLSGARQNLRARTPPAGPPGRPGHWALTVSRLLLLVLAAALAWGGVSLFQLLKPVPGPEWSHLGILFLLTLGRVATCLVLGLLWTLPVGLAIGLSEKWSRLFQPLLQVAASFPATLLFPVVVLLLKTAGWSLGVGSIVLMMMGTQWYILFNVIAGASAIPSDLKEVALAFRLRPLQKFLRLYLPALFPYLVTGLVTAAGGAWNASIVSEYVSCQGQVLTTPGLGSAISLAAAKGDLPLLAASVLVMSVMVVLLNLLGWLRLYHYSEAHFSLNA